MDGQRRRQTEIRRQMDGQRGDRQRGDRQTEKEKDRWTDRVETDREKETDREGDKQTDGQEERITKLHFNALSTMTVIPERNRRRDTSTPTPPHHTHTIPHPPLKKNM